MVRYFESQLFSPHSNWSNNLLPQFFPLKSPIHDDTINPIALKSKQIKNHLEQIAPFSALESKQD